MFKNYLKIAWRNLVKDRQFTFLNIFGLSVGLTCTFLIFLWVIDELSFDQFFNNNDRIYQLMEYDKNGGDESLSDGSSGPLSETVALQMPEVQYAAPVAPPGWFQKFTLSVNDKNIKATGQYTGKDYFNIFSFGLLEGDRNEMLKAKNSIVISDELALKLFGSANNLIGKAIRFQHDVTFYVSGVFEKAPSHSSQQFDFVLPWAYFKTAQDWVTSWDNIGPQNFILLKAGTDIKSFNTKIEGTIAANGGNISRRVMATKFSDNYLHNNFGNNSGGSARMEYVRLFSFIAVFILIIACINFINLSTAKASRRMKEIGIKKVAGSNRWQLIFQFLFETIFMTIFAMILAVIVAYLLLPWFNSLTGKEISIHFDWKILLAIVGMTILTGLLAGSYPALYLSKFNPTTMLKGKLDTSFAEVLSRKGLVIFQFSISVILIISVLIIYRQVQFIQNTNPGYKKDNLVQIDTEGTIEGTEDTFTDELKNIPGVVDASYTNARMVGHTFGDYGMSWAGKDPDDAIFFEVLWGGYDFMKTMGMHVVDGRGFSKEYGRDSTSIVINEAAAKVMKIENPVGQMVSIYDRPVRIIGVVKDFHFESLHEIVKPAIIQLQSHGSKIVTRIQGTDQKQTIASIQQLYEKYNPGFPFTFNFLNEVYQKQYVSETRVATLSAYFAVIAIVISCLGLFSLAAFTAQKRRKEIGIRKVIGANIGSIVAMLTKDFMKLILISLLIAFPVSWWLMQNWLRDFAYRIRIDLSVFLIAGFSVIVITFLTITFQSLKAAIANPVKSLRSE